MVKPLAVFHWTVAWALTASAVALAQPPAGPDTPFGPGPATDRVASVHTALSSAIECYRRGDYDQAAGLLQQVQVNQNELAPEEVNDLNNQLRLNNQALKARREGAEQLRQAEQAYQKGQTREAGELLKAVAANQFLTPADRRLAQELTGRMRSGPGCPSGPGCAAAACPAPAAKAGPAGTPDAAHKKLLEARMLLARGDAAGAQALAQEAARLGGAFAPEGDSPQKLLAELERGRRATAAPGPRPDARALTASARAALQRGDLDTADRLAQQAEQTASSAGLVPGWMRPWSDSPAKVRRDVQAARLRAAREGHPAGRPAANDQAMGGQARSLIKEGRAALRAGDVALARRSAEKAKALRPDLAWWEDTPDKLLDDVRRVEAAKGATPPEKAANLAPAVAFTPPGSKAAQSAPKADEDPRALLRQARQRYAAGKLDEAETLGRRADGIKTRWGLFEDTPDKLRIDLQNARVKRDREESVHIQAEARKLFNEGKLAEAKSKAFLALQKHGPYSIWDLGDRPDKLITEIEAAEYRNRKNKVPPVPPYAVVKKPRPEPKAGPDAPAPARDDARPARARELLAEARTHLSQGRTKEAAACAAQVEQLSAGWDVLAAGPAPWGNDLAALRRDLQQAPAPRTGPVVQAQAVQVPETNAPVLQDLAKQKAKMLLAEARGLQREGKLVEARQKALEAQRTCTTFGPEEDRPEMALIDLARLCDQRVAGLVQHATECIGLAVSDPARFEAAEADLRLAKQLSAGFGLDSQRVDSQVACLERARAAVLGHPPVSPPVPTAPAAEFATAAGPPPAPAPDQMTARQQGLVLLDKARLELRSGQTVQARRIAESAMTGPYDVSREAQELLRLIDVEEFNQKILAANRAADAAFAAFNRQDYAHAARIFAAIDVQKLSTERSNRLKEIMATPEMQAANQGCHAPDAGAVVQVKGPGKPGPDALDAAGRATATDLAPTRGGAEDGAMARVVGMQEIKFQELYDRGRTAQRDAMERFRAGDADQALEILRGFLDTLNAAELEEGRVAQLRRPVEDRLKKLTTLKAQREFERGQVAKGHSHDDMMREKYLMEKQKRDRVADLMKQYHALYQQCKYAEAEMTAQKALELDPDNVAADAAVHLSRMAKRHQTSDQLYKQKEQLIVDVLNDADNEGPSVTSAEPLHVDRGTYERTRKRKGEFDALWPRTHSPKEREIERRLEAPISLNFKDEKLDQAIEDLRDLSGVNVVPDKAALDEAGIGLDRELSLKVDNISLKSALNMLLRQAHLTYVIKDDALQITTEDNAKGRLKRVVYPVADLVVPVDNQTAPNIANFNYMMQRAMDNQVPPNPGVTPFTGPHSLYSGAPVSSPSGGGMAAAPPAGNAPRRPGQTIEDVLIQLITTTVAPESWADVGGQGTIKYFPLGLALVINQTLDIQEQIADLLAALRRLQDLEVAIELRLVAVSESFFERIGLDFNVNIVNTNRRYDNNLLNSNFQPFGFINKFTPNGFIAGITPAGTFTPDLNIPLRQDSFAFTTPPFGYPGVVGQDGGLSLGLAFLSDIQVFMFMEAAQGDRRMNVMQAPKLTMFNAQTATITVNDAAFFLTGVVPSFTPSGDLFFVPQNEAIPLGVTMTVVPVVSADRRFVRMNLNPILTNLSSANVPVIPIEIPIPQAFAGGAQGVGQDRLFQLFLQQPTFTNINIMTTVSVPDGGTVLLGGLKTLSEGRNEFGPPILSKIPYVNRLFKNVGYGRESQSLLIMVTPRIIINAEEEIRQTGGPGGEAGGAPGGAPGEIPAPGPGGFPQVGP